MNTPRGIKRAAAVVAALLITSTAAGCTGGGDGEARVDADGNPIVRVLVIQNTDQIDVADMPWTEEVEEDCACTIEWERVDGPSWDQQQSTTLAAGDVADVSIRAFGVEETTQYPHLFENLAEHLDELPNVRAYFEQKPDGRRLTETLEGEIRVLSSSRGEEFRGSGQHMLINQAWLDALNLQIPTTWDELTTVLEAFKSGDPNGNGQADEIPFQIAPIGIEGYGWFSPMLLLNSTGIVTQYNKGPSATGIFVKDGTVGNYLITEEYRSVLDYYHELMSRGLVPADAMTKDESLYWSEMESGRIGLVFGWSLDDFGDGRDEWAAMLPAAPGVPAAEVVWDGSDNEFEGNKLAVAAGAPNMDAILKVIDSLYSERISVQQLYGWIPDYVAEEGDHRYTVLPEAFADTQRYPALNDRLAGWIPDEVEFEGDIHADSLREVDDVYEVQYANFDDVRDMMPDYVRLSRDDQVTVGNNDTAILNYAMQAASRWIVAGGIDDEWDAYVEQLRALGLDENVAVWQQAYDEYVQALR